jgi:ABC-type transport system substrate-binding protein
VHTKSILAVADHWQRFGLPTEPVVVPTQRARDREYRANFPAFELVRQPDDLTRFHGKEAALPENGYNGGNRTRYQNPDFDGLLDRYFSTIPRAERAAGLGEVAHHMTDQVIVTGLFYDTQPAMISNRVAGAASGPVWNAHEWALR